jgi:uncharacterized protein (TIGR04562 family)
MDPSLQDSDAMLKKWSFNWGVMDVLIGGKSSIDLDRIRFRSKSEAQDFLKFYGYDPKDPGDARIINRVIVEAWNFIQTQLIPKEWDSGKRPPEKLLYTSDAAELLLAASNKDPAEKTAQKWACAVLKLMHTISHIDGVQRSLDSSKAKEQIMARFFDHIFRDEKGDLFFGKKNNAIALHKVEWKEQKSRQSMILKLLHKRANVAETIYDMIGVRIITKQLKDCMQAVKFLRDFHMVTFPNCNPSRAKNTLIDFDLFRQNIENFSRLLKTGQLNVVQFESFLDASMQPAGHGHVHKVNQENPHTAKSYRSIQLTCRQLVRYPDPSFSWLAKLQKAAEHKDVNPQGQQLLDHLLRLDQYTMGHHKPFGGHEVSGFFPFEVQIVDAQTYEANQLGAANHLNYKKSQIKAARRRILGSLLTDK